MLFGSKEDRLKEKAKEQKYYIYVIKTFNGKDTRDKDYDHAIYCADRVKWSNVQDEKALRKAANLYRMDISNRYSEYQILKRLWEVISPDPLIADRLFEIGFGTYKDIKGVENYIEYVSDPSAAKKQIADYQPFTLFKKSKQSERLSDTVPNTKDISKNITSDKSKEIQNKYTKTTADEIRDLIKAFETVCTQAWIPYDVLEKTTGDDVLDIPFLLLFLALPTAKGDTHSKSYLDVTLWIRSDISNLFKQRLEEYPEPLRSIESFQDLICLTNPNSSVFPFTKKASEMVFSRTCLDSIDVLYDCQKIGLNKNIFRNSEGFHFTINPSDGYSQMKPEKLISTLTKEFKNDPPSINLLSFPRFLLVNIHSTDIDS